MLVLPPNRVELTIPHCQSAEYTFLWHTVITPPLLLFWPRHCPAFSLLKNKQTKKARKLHFGPGTAAAAMPVPLQIPAPWFLASSPLGCLLEEEGVGGRRSVLEHSFSLPRLLLWTQEWTAVCSSPRHAKRKWDTCGKCTHSLGRKFEPLAQLNS